MTTKIAKGPLRRPLALAMVIALAAPGLAMAAPAKTSGKEAALEARVAQLEAQVQALLSQGQQAQAQLAEVRTAQAAVPVAPPAPKVPAGKTPIQLTTITPGAAPGTTIKIGGFIKADFMETKTGDGSLAEQSNGRYLYLPGTTPVGGAKSDTDFDAHAKFSRFNLGIDTVSEAGNKSGAFFEMDFFGGALGNQNATNTYGVTLRHAYMYWNEWLAGQTWSNFMDVGALPEAVDFVGPTDGVIFVRQAQLRYTKGGLSVSMENPETTTQPFATNPNVAPASIASDRGAVPDFTARYGWKGDWGTFGIGGLVRQLETNRPGSKDRTTGGGVTLGGKFIAGTNDDIRYQLTAGDGIGRYIGLGGINSDVAVASDGDLDSIGVVAGYVAWRHSFSPKLRTNVMYARSQYDNDIDYTGLGVTKSVESLRANIFYSPLPKVDVGAEVMYGKREVESGADGDITRLQFTTKYSF